MSPGEIFVWIGIGLHTAALYAVVFDFMRSAGPAHASLQIIAAFAVLLAGPDGAEPLAVVLPILWIGAGLIALLRRRVAAPAVRFNAEEQRFLLSKLPRLDAALARRLLSRGRWVDGEVGDVLAREAEPIAHLAYLSKGRASVSVGGRVIDYCEDDTMIGEMTALEGEPATATVVLIEPSRYFRIAAPMVRTLAKTSPETRHALRECFGADMRRKLVAANLSRRDQAAQRAERWPETGRSGGADREPPVAQTSPVAHTSPGAPSGPGTRSGASERTRPRAADPASEATESRERTGRAGGAQPSP